MSHALQCFGGSPMLLTLLGQSSACNVNFFFARIIGFSLTFALNAKFSHQVSSEEVEDGASTIKDFMMSATRFSTTAAMALLNTECSYFVHMSFNRSA